jgi:hypothetical protein
MNQRISGLLLAESSAPKFTDAPRIDKSVLALGDVELPLHHAEFINNCMRVAHAWGIRCLALVGDFIHWGALSSFPDSPNDASAEIEQIETYLRPFVEPWDEVWWTKGNHDARVGLAMDRLLKLEHAARLIVPNDLADEFRRKVKCSDYYYAYVGDDWLIEHPKATNAVPANAARGLAETYEHNVAMAHNHLVGVQQTADGKRWGVEIGCCADPERLAYAQMRHRKRPRMRNGALILRRVGNVFYPTLLTPEWTDWEWELRGVRGEGRGARGAPRAGSFSAKPVRSVRMKSR